MKKIFLDSKLIKYFIVDARGKIIKTGDRTPSTWEGTTVKLDSLEVGEPLELTFNGKVYTKLNYNTTKIEEIN